MVSPPRWVAPVAVGLAAFVLARWTLLPGVAFWDTAELQAVAPLMGTAHPTGFPTYVVLGWLASVVLQPFGEPAFRMNLFSALSVAVAAAVTVDLVRALTGSRAIGIAAGLGLAVTPVVWDNATHAEAHTLHLALVAILLRLLVGWEDRRRAADPDARAGADRWLAAAAVVFGLSLGNHSLTLLLAVPVGLFVLAVEPGIVGRPRFIAACAAALAATVVLVYLELPLRAGPFRAPLVYGRPETWDGFWYIVLAEQFRGSLSAPFADMAGKVAALVDRSVGAFGPLTPLVPLGLAATVVVRPRYALLTGLGALITVFFAASYDNAAIERYDLGPILFAWTWLAILAASAAGLLARAWRGGIRREEPRGQWRPALPAGGVARVLVATLLVLAVLPGVPRTFERVDASGDRLAERWLDDVDAALEPNAVVVSWWSFSTPLWYAQHVEGRRPDIEIIDDRTRLDRDLGSVADVINAHLGARPVYVIRPANELAALEEDYVIESIHVGMPDPLARVLARREAGS